MPPKKFQVKKNHHHVWARYLQEWSADGKDVWHTTLKGKISLHSIRDICREDYFYKSNFLTSDHMKMIEGFSKLGDDDAQAMHAKYLSDFVFIQQLEKLYRNHSVSDAQVERMFETFRCNTIENYHGAHEREAAPIVSQLLEGDFTPLHNDKDLIMFLNFLGHQLTRTKTFKDRVLEAVPKTGLGGLDQDRFKTVLEECWFFISYMYGMNIGRNLYFGRQRTIFCILENSEDEPFITSDSPVINLCNTEDRKNLPDVDQLDLYYPLSPERAIVACRSGAFPPGITKVSKETVEDVNLTMAQHARAHIIGSEEEVIKRYHREIDGIS
ncbi:hypothetical protein RA25_02805 [Leisingera sp. ANG-S5]|nr:hypothetical protein RA25_02805 [Leisingera sp. ANG-S5]